jgi:hypothetical protein
VKAGSETLLKHRSNLIFLSLKIIKTVRRLVANLENTTTEPLQKVILKIRNKDRLNVGFLPIIGLVGSLPTTKIIVKLIQ